MNLTNYFQLSPIPANAISGTYSPELVILSYFVACMASFVALDITERLRSEVAGESSFFWLCAGSFAMGLGIWTMHFIGMLAFIMPMPMYYNPFITVVSLLLAVIASALAFLLIKNRNVKLISLISGGVVLGIAIVSMHYTGMSAMEGVEIHYLPSLFILSLIVALIASEAALWLMIKSSSSKSKYRMLFKIGSSLIMGLAICGMHYTGMAAAIFTGIGHDVSNMHTNIGSLNPTSLSIFLGSTTILIMIIALSASKIWMNTMKAKNQQLVTTARLAGMAEVAACVLHNFGNVLNSISVSIQIMLERENNSKVSGLIQLSEKINENKDQIEKFMTTDPIGKALPEYLVQFANYLKDEQSFIHKELDSLHSKVQHIKTIVQMQQTLKGSSSIDEEVQLNQLLDDALSINAELIEKYGIKVEKNYSNIPSFETDKVKAMETFINLLKNAVESLIESQNKEKILKLITKLDDNSQIHIEVTDNGLGITEENITKVFSYGFSTKKTGHGFGLHASSLAAQEAGGSLYAYSKGLNQGATFELVLPIKSKNK